MVANTAATSNLFTRMSNSLLHRAYYMAKPFMPDPFRYGVRSLVARRRRRQTSDVWPILPGSDRRPDGWPGWPEGKKFALVLTHDVEGITGVDNCRQLMDLEDRMGMRSSYNFIPEGSYRVPRELRKGMEKRGFEVGVHDLRHDGSLYQNRQAFGRQALRINEHLKDWGVSGFRAGFMFHNLDWNHDLKVAYDASTFDTDPFEPQNDGVGTIFPFWQSNGHGGGYAELPYTLAQDSTLFYLFGEKTIELWEKKLDWVAEHGGMALVNTHPDYMCFDSNGSAAGRHQLQMYEQLLRMVKTRYEGQFWHVLPREVARHVHEHKYTRVTSTGIKRRSPAPDTASVPRKKIWIDLENTPHIPFFRPIIDELESRGYRIVLSARDAYQTCEMAERYGIPFRKIGHHYGKHRLMKGLGLITRSAQLIPFLIRERPALGLNHGSRTQNLICNLFSIPTITIMDYEHTGVVPMVAPRWEIVPDALGVDHPYSKSRGGHLTYPGIKEDVYVPRFHPDSSITEELSLNQEAIIVTVRPPATEAHYHNPEAEALFSGFMERVYNNPQVQAVVLPRNKLQEAWIRQTWPHWFKNSKVIIPEKVVDGLNLLWHSDLAVSGGGTMNREAAALGVPVYSIFRGRIGAVDRQLESQGRLTLIENQDDVKNKIVLERRSRDLTKNGEPRAALSSILEHIESIHRVYWPEPKVD